MPEYTLAAVVSVVLVMVLELAWLRTGMFRRPAFWITAVIVFGFQIPVDGWLTKLSAPIVLYAESHASGIRAPWDIPVEDFAFGFSLMTLTLLLWDRLGSRERDQDHGRARGRASTAPPPPASAGRAPGRER
ncbi:lycopene cyclase domain-containing protein [Actinopolymorpha cephalotaxi]|uniref:Lycopene cyclase domain-containing protein n=1 Tax=Actinopolymorpha cephalotaxi TaxID=504797 RepID=A0A1I2YDL9_9ACTN|nr:lycopene cyclase domain-containing protein [Actinopolymorpha cephalotaxi]NYH87047.1 lycopene cyclase domain-containing protein [Actinopolymorpha cephalotaxi]SFH23126.1 lycopene cyclase domain-containing protein [Actinopolymorpha cephalotaxi]